MIKYIIPVLLFTAFLYAQDSKKEIVASAGDKEITVSEFQERYELNPQVQIQRKQQGDANKKIFLYGLLAEKLLALDAADHNYDTSEGVQFYLKNFEKMFVRDELYRKEIKGKSKKYAQDILSFYLENSSKIFTKNIISQDEKQIKDIYALLQKGMPFDSVYADLSPSEKDTITLYAGTLDELTEHELFTMPEKSISKPLNYNEHWVIFYIDKKNDPVIAKSMGWESEYKRLEKAAREKAEAVYFKEYMKKFFPDKKAEANGFLIKSLAEKLNQLLREGTDKKYTAASYDFVKAERMFTPDTLNMTFIKSGKTTVLFKDFISWLRTENFELKENTFQAAASLLNAKAKKYTEFELLAAEGYRQGLEKSESVKNDLAMWRDNYLYQLRLSALSDSLLGKQTGESYYKVIEIVNNDLNVIEKALNESSSGTDFTKLALEYSTEKPDTSYRPLSSLGEIRDEIVNLNVGEIYGPVNSSKGYILFKVENKKDAGEIPGGKTNSAGNSTVFNPFNGYISGLAKKYGITINNEILSEVRNTYTNALVFRYMGFGGRLSAVPVIVPIFEWFKDYKENSPINP